MRAGFYREGQLEEGQPSLWAGDFSIVGRVCQPVPVTGRDWGMLGEPGVCFDVHLSPFSLVQSQTSPSRVCVATVAGQTVFGFFCYFVCFF